MPKEAFIEIVLADNASALISEAARETERLSERVQNFFFNRLLGSSEFFRIETKGESAAGARRGIMTLNLGNSFLEFLAAIRAGNGERYVAEIEARV